MSGAEDIAKWLIVQLDSGRVAGAAPIFSPASTRQLWREVTPEPIGDPAPGLEQLRPHFLGYALGVGNPRLSGQADADPHGGPSGLCLPPCDDP